MNASPSPPPDDRWADAAQLPDTLRPLANALADRERIADGASGRARPPQPRHAAVLILVGDGAFGGELLFIERAQTLRAHPGEVAFPGGRYEDADGDLIATALRESREETGLDPSSVAVFGSLPAVSVPVSGYDVTAVVGWWHRPGRLGVVDPGEVTAIQQIPIAALADPKHRVQVRHPSGHHGPGFLTADVLIWGMTAHLVDRVLELADWEQPWDRSKIVEDPDRYRREGSAMRPAMGANHESPAETNETQK